MKDQERLDKQLRQKLNEAEVTPPSMLFDKIMDELESEGPTRRPVWYLAVRFQRVAASVAILAIASMAWLAWPKSDSRIPGADQLAGIDSFLEESLDTRLKNLERVAEAWQVEHAKIIEEAVQPTREPVRLASMNAEKKSTEVDRARAEQMQLDPMMPIEGIFLESDQPLPELYTSADQFAVLPTAPGAADEDAFELPSLRDSYSILSDRKLLAFARSKFDEFASKEHYVSFNLGNLEFGQTIQLSKKQKNN